MEGCSEDEATEDLMETLSIERKSGEIDFFLNAANYSYEEYLKQCKDSAEYGHIHYAGLLEKTKCSKIKTMIKTDLVMLDVYCSLEDDIRKSG